MEDSYDAFYELSAGGQAAQCAGGGGGDPRRGKRAGGGAAGDDMTGLAVRINPSPVQRKSSIRGTGRRRRAEKKQQWGLLGELQSLFF